MEQQTIIDTSQGQQNGEIGLANLSTIHTNEVNTDAKNSALKSKYFNSIIAYFQMKDQKSDTAFPKPDVPKLWRVIYPEGQVFPYTFQQDVQWLPPEIINVLATTETPELSNPIGPLHGRSSGGPGIWPKLVNWYEDLSGYRSARPSAYKAGDTWPAFGADAGRYVHFTWPNPFQGKDHLYHLWADTKSAGDV